MPKRDWGSDVCSSDLTRCVASGCSESIFMPSLSQSRPAADISVLLFGGPTAWEDRLALLIERCTRASSPRSFTRSTRALGSESLNGLRPLKRRLNDLGELALVH